MRLNQKPIPSDQLRLVAHREEFHDDREPPLLIGNRVRLNSGGPEMLVVDTSENEIVAAWNALGKNHEHAFPRLCVHRVRN